MESTDSLLYSLVGLIIGSLVLWGIISSATKSEQRNKILLQNQKLLALLAEKLGCDVSTINDVMKGRR